MIIRSLSDVPSESVSHNPDIQKKVMLRYNDLPNLTNFAQARFAPGQISPGHSHKDMCEVFFVESGSGIIRVDGIEYLLFPGSCYGVEVGEVHEIVNTGTEELVLTYFGLQV
jgi:mannose-6-phosphate isomerase-like protein (cupin superfamily)